MWFVVGPRELPWLAFRAQAAEVERRGFRKWWSRNLCAHNAAAVCRRAASFTMGVFHTLGQYSRRPAGLRGWLLEASALSRAASATNGPRTSKRYVTARNRKDEEIAKLRLRLLKHQTLQERKPNSWVVQHPPLGGGHGWRRPVLRIALAQAAPLPLGKACGKTLFILVRPWLVPQGGTITN